MAIGKQIQFQLLRTVTTGGVSWPTGEFQVHGSSFVKRTVFNDSSHIFLLELSIERRKARTISHLIVGFATPLIRVTQQRYIVAYIQ